MTFIPSSEDDVRNRSDLDGLESLDVVAYMHVLNHVVLPFGRLSKLHHDRAWTQTEFEVSISYPSMPALLTVGVCPLIPIVVDVFDAIRARDSETVVKWLQLKTK